MQGLGTPPALDLGMVTTAQRFGHTPTTKLCRTGVVRFFQQAPSSETLCDRADLVAHRPWQQAYDRLDHQARGHFSPAQDDIADAQLPVDQVLANPVIDPFIPSAQQAEPVAGREFVRHRLVEAATSGTEQQQRP